MTGVAHSILPEAGEAAPLWAPHLHEPHLHDKWQGLGAVHWGAFSFLVSQSDRRRPHHEGR